LPNDLLEYLFRQVMKIVGSKGWTVHVSGDGLTWTVYKETESAEGRSDNKDTL